MSHSTSSVRSRKITRILTGSLLLAVVAAGAALLHSSQADDQPTPVHVPGADGLYFMGATGAYVKVCGCAESLKGGYNRVAAYLEREHGLGAEERTYALVDAGEFVIADDDLARPRNIAGLELLSWLRPVAANVGAGDLVFGEDFLLEHGGALDFVGAGVGRLADKQSVPGWRLVHLGDLPVGLIGLGATPDRGDLDAEEAQAWVKQAADEAREAGARSLVLLSAQDIPTSRSAAAAAGGMAVILVADEARSEEPRDGEGGPLVTTGEKAHFLGKLKLDPATGDLDAVEWIELDAAYDSFAPEAFEARIDAYLAETEKLATANAEERKLLANEGLEIPYVGSKRCQLCHPQQFDDWVDPFPSGPNHFKAYRIFTELVPEEQRKRATPQCVACHVVGFRKLEPLEKDAPPRYVWHEDGVGCEVCHGPGGKHVTTGLKEHIERGSLLTARETLCARCHVPDHSPDFDYLKYLKKIRHWPAELEAPLRNGEVEVPSGPPDCIPETPFCHKKG